jgi:hypothetical protein
MGDRQSARELYAYIRRCEADGVPPEGLRDDHARLARLYEVLAMRERNGGGLGSWPELFAAITEYAQAGEADHVARLIALGHAHSPDRSPSMHAELTRLEEWAAGLPIAADYRREFAELAVARKLGTLIAAAENEAEQRLEALLRRMPAEVRESCLRWAKLQPAPAPITAPLRLGVERADPTVRPFEPAA